MADIERSLISKIISTGELHEVIGLNIEADHFADEDCAEIFDWMLDFQRQFKATPSARAVKEEFPQFAADISKDPLSYHVEKFIIKAKERAAIDLVRNYHDAIEDPELLPEIELYALEMARNLIEVVPSPRVHRFSAMPKRTEQYELNQLAGIHPGINFGIPTIDRATDGYQPADLIVYVAYFGVGKSQLMQYVSYMTYLQKKTSEIISLEMSGEQILRKLDTLASKVKYAALKALELEAGDMEQWKRVAEQAHKDRHERDIIIRDDIKNCTVDKIQADMMRFKPDAMFVDYLELMHTPRSQSRGAWENVSENGIGLKQAAHTMKIPVHTAAQLNREGGKGEVTLANISYQSVGKHSDILIGLSQDEDQENKQEMELIALKIRDAKKGQRPILRWMLETMDIGEKGMEEHFPIRKKDGKRPVKATRQQRRQIEIARNIEGRPNPWARKRGDHDNPFVRKIKR